MTMNDQIENFMTHAVHTIGVDRPLTEAHELMAKHRIRHLPVLDGGKLVGMLTDRDLALVESFGDVDQKKDSVAEAMSPDVFAVELGTPVAVVAHQMARRKIGSAVVQRGTKVVGIFTAIDALSAVDFLLSLPSVKQALDDLTKGAGRNATA